MATRRLFSTAISTASRRLTTTTATPRLSLIRTLSAMSHLTVPTLPPSSQRFFCTQQASNSGNGNTNPDSKETSKETVLLDGCDFEHWLIVMDPPPQEWSREQIIDYYVKTLATAVGSEEEARMKLYSVSTKHYFAFGALVPEEVSSKLKDLEKVRWVLPDSYLDVRNKDYGGEPVINGQAVPYDPKYHEEWVRNNLRAQDRNNRNDRPRNDRPRNFDNRQQRPPPGGNMGGSPNRPPPNNAGYQQNMPPRNNAGYQQNNAGYQQNMPPPNHGGYPPNMPPNTAAGFQNAPNGNYQAQGVPGGDGPQ